MDKLMFLKRDKRMLFSIIGIIVASVLLTLITNLSQVAIDELNKQMLSFSSDKLIILPFKLSGVSSSSGIRFFKPADLKKVLSLPCVTSGYGAVATRTLPLTYKSQQFFALIIGSEEYVKDFKVYMPLKEGRYIKKRGEILVGYSLADQMDIKLNDKIYIKDKPFRVVGILKQQETQTGGINTDTSVFITLKDAQSFFGEIYYFMVFTTKCNDVKTQIERLLKGDITIISSEFFKEQLNTAFTYFTLGTTILGVIGGVVASLGVINSMIASVVRRKKAIALMKVFGMTNAELFNMLLWESGTVTLLGITIGLLLGIIIYLVIILYMGWELYFSFNTFIGLSIVGLLGTFLPAWFGLREIQKITPKEAMSS